MAYVVPVDVWPNSGVHFFGNVLGRGLGCYLLSPRGRIGYAFFYIRLIVRGKLYIVIIINYLIVFKIMIFL